MGLAGNDLANGFEIVIICPCAGSTGREEEMGGVTKEMQKERQNARKGKKDGGRRTVVRNSSIKNQQT